MSRRAECGEGGGGLLDLGGERLFPSGQLLERPLSDTASAETEALNDVWFLLAILQGKTLPSATRPVSLASGV